MTNGSTLGRNAATERRLLAEMMNPLRVRTGMDMVFGGPVARTGTRMRITDLAGTRTEAPRHLLVSSGEGLGGKALKLGRPAAVSDYFASDGITHVYDHAVRPEGIVTLVAIPVVARTPRALLYFASRAQVALGDRWLDTITPMVAEMAQRILVEDEVKVRLAEVERESRSSLDGPSRGELMEIADEMRAIASRLGDADLRARIDRLLPRAGRGATHPGQGATRLGGARGHTLRPREMLVLKQVALGSSNQEIADDLGLTLNTVKSYVKSAMAALAAPNRIQAVLRARDLGEI